MKIIDIEKMGEKKKSRRRLMHMAMNAEWKSA